MEERRTNPAYLSREEQEREQALEKRRAEMRERFGGRTGRRQR